jgi:hypothetical protein
MSGSGWRTAIDQVVWRLRSVDGSHYPEVYEKFNDPESNLRRGSFNKSYTVSKAETSKAKCYGS